MGMVLPMNYAEIEQEEMVYLEGGFYMSNKQVKNIMVALGVGAGVNAVTLAAAIKINSVWMGTQFGALGGPIGALTGAALGLWISSQAVVIAERMVTAAVHGKGVKWGLGVSWGIIPGITGTIK